MAASQSNLFARASKVVYIASLNKYFWTSGGCRGEVGRCCLRACFQGERVTLACGLPYHSHISFSFLLCVYKAARVTRIGGLPF